MQGKVRTFNERTGLGLILFDLIEFPFSLSDCEGSVILRRGDEVRFNLQDRDGEARAFDVRLDWGVS